MKRIVVVAILTALAGCATQKPAVTVVQACAVYGASLQAALAARQAGKLSDEAREQILKVDESILQICGPTAKLPADANAAVLQVETAAATLATLEATKPAK